jgi:hypothetical protein
MSSLEPAPVGAQAPVVAPRRSAAVHLVSEYQDMLTPLQAAVCAGQSHVVVHPRVLATRVPTWYGR